MIFFTRRASFAFARRLFRPAYQRWLDTDSVRIIPDRRSCGNAKIEPTLNKISVTEREIGSDHRIGEDYEISGSLR